MNQKSARVTANEIFQREPLRFADVPGQSKLFIDFQTDSAAHEKFYPEKNTALETFAGRVLANYKIDRGSLCDILLKTNESFGAGRETLKNIERLRGENCLAIVTGQQATLFSGALYTIYKILSAVKLAADLQKKNIEAVPVFWIAEEDHDFDEVKKAFNISKEGKLTESENTPENYRENQPVGFVKLDETIKDTINDLFEQLSHTEFSDELKKTLLETYQPAASYSQAFARFLTRILDDYGVIILSPLDSDLKQLCVPIFVETIEKSAAISSALMRRETDLKAAGVHSQVLVTESYFPFFLQNENGQRQSLRRNTANGKITVPQTKTEFEIAELLKIARESPQNLSPNALMRSVVQDYLLPTLVYYGGAAEIAYFAQNSVLYEVLNRPVTPIRHRSSFTLIERKHARTLNKYEFDFAELSDGKEKIWARVVDKFLKRETARVFTEVTENINQQMNRLNEFLTNDEPTLVNNLAVRRKKIAWHLSALQQKYYRTEKQKNDAAYRRVENLFAALLPNDALQERTLNVVTFLNLYGSNFVRWIYESIETDDRDHQILYF